MPTGNTQSNAFDDYAEATIHHKVDALIGRYGYREQDREDLEQDLRLCLLERLQGFTPETVQRTTYIDRIVCQRIADMIRAKKRQCRDRRLETCVADDETGQGNDLDLLTGDCRHPDLRSAELRDDLAVVMERLPDQQRQICKLLTTHSKEAIKRLFGMNRRSFDAEMLEIRKAFQAREMHAYLA